MSSTLPPFACLARLASPALELFGAVGFPSGAHYLHVSVYRVADRLL